MEKEENVDLLLSQSLWASSHDFKFGYLVAAEPLPHLQIKGRLTLMEARAQRLYDMISQETTGHIRKHLKRLGIL
jgi:hypothetical protein